MALKTTFPSGITDQNSDYKKLADKKNALRIEKGNMYRLAKAGAAIPINTVLMFSALDGSLLTDADWVGLTVIVTTGPTVAVVGANATGAIITSGNYFWMLVDGIGVLIGTGTVAVSDKLMPGAAGTVATFAANANESNGAGGNVFCGVALEADIAVTYYVTSWFRAEVAGDALAA